MRKQKSVKVSKPRRKAESASLAKYKKFKKLFRLYSLKKELNESGFPEPYSAGDAAKMKKYKAKMMKARKLAAPELIKLGRARRRSVGKGGGTGKRLAKL
jgi:hypothetical protein